MKPGTASDLGFCQAFSHKSLVANDSYMQFFFLSKTLSAIRLLKHTKLTTLLLHNKQGTFNKLETPLFFNMLALIILKGVLSHLNSSIPLCDPKYNGLLLLLMDKRACSSNQDHGTSPATLSFPQPRGCSESQLMMDRSTPGEAGVTRSSEEQQNGSFHVPGSPPSEHPEGRNTARPPSQQTLMPSERSCDKGPNGKRRNSCSLSHSTY